MLLLYYVEFAGIHTDPSLRFGGNYVEFAGIHTDPSLRFGGNRLSKLAVRSDDRTAQTSGLSGCS